MSLHLALVILFLFTLCSVSMARKMESEGACERESRGRSGRDSINYCDHFSLLTTLDSVLIIFRAQKRNEHLSISMTGVTPQGAWAPGKSQTSTACLTLVPRLYLLHMMDVTRACYPSHWAAGNAFGKEIKMKYPWADEKVIILLWSRRSQTVHAFQNNSQKSIRQIWCRTIYRWHFTHHTILENIL